MCVIVVANLNSSIHLAKTFSIAKNAVIREESEIRSIKGGKKGNLMCKK